MAHKEYYAEWLKIKDQLRVALAEDVRLQELAKAFVGIKPQATAVEIVSRVYCKFCDLYNRLCEIYDQMAQAQRRTYIRKIIDAITCRLLELKWTLEEVEVFEFVYPDNALQQLLMTPQNVEIMCPFHYPFEIRQQEMQYIIDEIFAGNRIGDPSPTASEIERKEEERIEEERIRQEEKEAEIKRLLAMGEDIPESVETIVYTEAELEEMRLKEEYERHVNNIQRMERSRIVIKDNEHKKIKDINLFLELSGQKAPQARLELREKAAKLIQAIYRRFMELKREHLREMKLRYKLDMILSAYKPPSAKEQLERVKEVRREFRRKYHQQWMDKNIKEHTRILRLRKDDIMEDITVEVRQWFIDWYKEVKMFDEFPWPEEGGTVLVVQGETFTLEEYIEWRKAEDKRLKSEAQNPKSKEQIQAEKREAREEKKRLALDAKEKEKKRLDEYRKLRLNPDNDPGVYVSVGENVEQLQNAWNEYEIQWKFIDTAGAPLQAIKGYIMELITENVYMDLNLELRPIVDEMMRLELALLRVALKNDYDLGGYPTPKAPVSKKRKRPKRVKPPKPDKISPQAMFQVLADEGIVKKYPKTTLDDYWGDRNYAAADFRAIPWTPAFPPPCIGDVREQVRMRCLLTLGSNCPNAERSQMLVGPRNAGKKTLVYAIATETNSILIDLSPMNVYNKFPGKNLKQMFTFVTKISKLMQPSIIFIENVDKMFYKKVPKEEKMFDPTRLSKDFFKEIVKQIKEEDKILVLGTAAEPWLAKGAMLYKAFPSMIMIPPRTDYGSITYILSKLLMGYHGMKRDFNVHSVAQTLRGYDIATIKKGISRLMSGKRVAELYYKPLEPVELLSAVIDCEDAVYTDNEDAMVFKDWYLSYSPWGQKYLDYMIMLDSQLIYKTKKDQKKKKA